MSRRSSGSERDLPMHRFATEDFRNLVALISTVTIQT